MTAALFELADAALYAAKAQGRGKAVLADRRRAEGPIRALGEMRARGADVAARVTDTGEAADAIVQDWLEAFQVSGCALSLLTDDGTALRCMGEAWGGGQTSVGDPGLAPLAAYPSTARALAERTTYVCAIDDPDADPAEVAVLRRVNAAAMLLVPLVVGDRPIGIVELFDGRPRRFTSDERRLALMLGDYVAATLQEVVGRP